MKIFISKLNPKTKGETIIEVLTAVVILTIVLTTAFTILNRALYANVDNRNRVIALNIAREGIEAVRNIRDTNWLKYSGDRRGKWLCWDPVGGNACDGSATSDTIIEDDGEPYYIIFYEGGRYYLSRNEAFDESGSGIQQNELNLSSSTITFSEYRLNTDAVSGRFTHRKNSMLYNTLTNAATPFHRQIELRVVNPTTDDIEANSTKASYCNDSPTGSKACENAALHVTSRVQWKEGEAVQKAVLETVLFDFYEREEY